MCAFVPQSVSYINFRKFKPTTKLHNSAALPTSLMQHDKCIHFCGMPPMRANVLHQFYWLALQSYILNFYCCNNMYCCYCCFEGFLLQLFCSNLNRSDITTTTNNAKSHNHCSSCAAPCCPVGKKPDTNIQFLLSVNCIVACCGKLAYVVAST